MTVRVLLFAAYADALGRDALDLALPAGATAADALAAVRALPGAERLPARPLLAVNERWAAAERALADGDEVAIVPPVAGG
jgi:molybdopterin converting factor small subunit